MELIEFITTATGGGAIATIVTDDCTTLNQWNNTNGYTITTWDNKTCIKLPSKNNEEQGAYWNHLLSRDKEFDFKFKAYLTRNSGYIEFRFGDRNLNGGWSQNAFSYMHEGTYGQTRQNGTNTNIQLEKAPTNTWTEINIHHNGSGTITITFGNGNSYTINQSYINGGWYFSPRAWTTNALYITDIEYAEY